jgi:hypothetical protein
MALSDVVFVRADNGSQLPDTARSASIAADDGSDPVNGGAKLFALLLFPRRPTLIQP